MGIFWTPDDSTKIEKVTMPWAAETYFIPEGTPMSSTGIANNGDAIGILAQDANLRYAYTYGSNPQGKVDFEFSIMTAGFVNLNKAQESFGGEYSDECKSALTNIVFVDDQNPSSFGGGGEEKFIVTFTVDDNNIATPDKTEDEIEEAFSNGLRVVGLIPDLFDTDEFAFTYTIGDGVYTIANVDATLNEYVVYQIVLNWDENDNLIYTYVEKVYSLTELG